MMNFAGKTAVVTGGSRGIGRAICEELARGGANVVLCYAGRAEAAQETVAACEALGAKALAVQCNVADEAQVKALMDAAVKEFGRIDILVNNAGWCPVQPITELTIEDYDRAFSLDVRAVVELTLHALPLIRQSKGSILNLSSVGATHRAPNLSMYVGAKAAIENFTRVWAMELAGDGVRVNAIAPGAIRTNIWNVTDLSPEAAKAHEDSIAAGIPFGRFGTPEEVANVAAFLASEEASYISGAICAVDGAQGAA